MRPFCSLVPKLLQKSGCRPCHNFVFNIDAFSFCLVVTLVLTEVKSSSEDCLLTHFFALQGMVVYMDWHSHLHTFVYICIDLHSSGLCLAFSYLFGSVLNRLQCARMHMKCMHTAAPTPVL